MHGRMLGLLLGPHQPKIVASRLQAFYNFAQGMCHAVDIGWIGFSDHSDIESLLH